MDRADNKGFRRDRGRIITRIKELPKKWLILIIIVAVLGTAQLERFISQGTLLGYKVRGSSQQDKNDYGPTGLDQTVKDTEACKKISLDEVSREMETEIERIGGIFEDRRDPTFTSTCTYRTKLKPSRTITIVLRDAQDEEAAKGSIANALKNKETEKVKLGDESVFTKTSQQLMTRKGKRINTINISKASESSKKESKLIAESLMKELL